MQTICSVILYPVTVLLSAGAPMAYFSKKCVINWFVIRNDSETYCTRYDKAMMNNCPGFTKQQQISSYKFISKTKKPQHLKLKVVGDEPS